jgi:hypothetical protein
MILAPETCFDGHTKDSAANSQQSIPALPPVTRIDGHTKDSAANSQQSIPALPPVTRMPFQIAPKVLAGFQIAAPESAV